MEKVYDAIVVGSGIGGLAAAAVLASIKRYRVLVLEQHFKLGGFTHTFQRPGGYHWDVGLHYVGEMSENNPLRRIMDFITAGEVKWAKMKDPFEVFLYPGLRFEVPSGKEAYLKKLKDHFPAESAPLRRYFRDLDRIVQNLPGTMGSPARAGKHEGYQKHLKNMGLQTLGTYLEKNFKDPKLKALLASQWGDYGLPPRSSSLGLHAIIARHYLE